MRIYIKKQFMRDLIMIAVGIYIWVIILVSQISFETKCFLSGGKIENEICILNK